MFDLNPLFEFSRTHCISVCAILVPANLLATLQTMLFAAFGRSVTQVHLMAVAASFYALLLLLHVFTWFAIGVVMAPTFILTFLGCLCLGINFCAVSYQKMQGINSKAWGMVPLAEILQQSTRAANRLTNQPASK